MARLSKIEVLLIELLDETKWNGLTIAQIAAALSARGYKFGNSSIAAICLKLIDQRVLARRWDWFHPESDDPENNQMTRRHVYYLPMYSPRIAGHW